MTQVGYMTLQLRFEILMLSASQPIHSSRLWRAIYAVFAFLVLSYMFFDVLDLDGSNFPSVVAPEETTVIVAVMPSGAELHDSPEALALWGTIPPVFTDSSAKFSWLRRMNVFRFSSLNAARFHGYRAGLARDSLPHSSTDSSPYS